MSLYYSMIYPYLLYGNLLWGNATATALWPIFRAQKRAIRLISNRRRRDSTSPIFNKFKMLKLPDIYTYSATIFMHNYFHEKLPTVFNNFFTRNLNHHRHLTRSSMMYRTPLYKSKIGNIFIRKTGVLIWNNFTETSDSNCSMAILKKIVIETMISEYIL